MEGQGLSVLSISAMALFRTCTSLPHWSRDSSPPSRRHRQTLQTFPWCRECPERPLSWLPLCSLHKKEIERLDQQDSATSHTFPARSLQLIRQLRENSDTREKRCDWNTDKVHLNAVQLVSGCALLWLQRLDGRRYEHWRQLARGKGLWTLMKHQGSVAPPWWLAPTAGEKTSGPSLQRIHYSDPVDKHNIHHSTSDSTFEKSSINH